MLKIRQSYHGNGSREGYKWKVYNEKGKKLGELENLPTALDLDDVVMINGTHYFLDKYYASDNPRHEKTEVMFYEFLPYQHEIKYVDLGEIK